MFVRCGKATAVLLERSNEPQVIDRRMVLLADPDFPHSIQPYHVFETQSGKQAEQLLEKCKGIVLRVSTRSIAQLFSDYQKLGHRPRRAVLVVGSLIDPNKIKNEHIRWHALEGQLFRTSVEKALKLQNVRCSFVLASQVYTRSAEILAVNEESLKLKAKNLGHSLSPWRSEDKAAAIAVLPIVMKRS
ncbi:MAG TPA: hypothetical protein VI958_00860 [Acidobacteriota bacterium]